MWVCRIRSRWSGRSWGERAGGEDEDKAQGEWLPFRIVPMSVVFRMVILLSSSCL